MHKKYKYALIGGVGVLVIVGITLGIVFGIQGDDEEPTCRSYNSPSNVEFTEETDGVVLSWGSPSNSEGCTVKYKLIFSIDDNEEVTEEVDVTTFKFDASTLEPCTEIKVRIVAVSDEDESDSSTESYTKAVTEGFGSVSEIQLSDADRKLQATWLGPVGFSKCEIEYRLEVNSVTKTTTELSYTLDDMVLEYCRTTVVRIAPVIKEVDGVSLTAEINPEIKEGWGQADSVIIKWEEGRLKGSWNRPAATEACDLSYSLKIIADGVESTATMRKTSYDFNVETLVPCVIFVIYVTPSINDIPGMEALHYHKEIPEPIDPVEDLTAVDGEETIDIYWTDPIGYDRCNMNYYVTMKSDAYEETSYDITYYIPYKLLADSSCLRLDYEISVMIDTTYGTVKTNAVVRDFQSPASLRYTTKRIQWTEVNKKICEPYYTLAFEYLGKAQESYDLTNDFYDLQEDLQTCQTMYVSVVAKSQTFNAESEPALATFRGSDPTRIGIITNEEIIENSEENNFKISWTAPGGLHFCALEYKISIAKDGLFVVTDTVTTTEWTSEQPLSNYCPEFEVSVTAMYNTLNGWEYPFSYSC